MLKTQEKRQNIIHKSLSFSTSQILDIKRFSRQILKLTLSFISLISYLAIMLPAIPLSVIAPHFTFKYLLVPSGNLIYETIRKIINLKVIESGDFTSKKNVFVAMNHQSYLDYFVCQALTQGSFISTVEMRQVPFFGLIAELNGSIFIERRNPKNLKNEINAVTKTLSQGTNIFIFPEAKASNGNQVLPFKRPFFKVTKESQSDIQLITVNYLNISGQAITAENKDKVLWYQNTSFIKHVWNLLGEKEITVSAKGNVMHYESYSQKEQNLSQICHEQIAKDFIPLTN